MIFFKACPRCRTGDLSLVEDIYGKYVQCFQCGHVIFARAEEAVFQAEAITSVKRRSAA